MTYLPPTSHGQKKLSSTRGWNSGERGGVSFVQEDPRSLTWCDYHLGPLPKTEFVVPIGTLRLSTLQNGPGFAHCLLEDRHTSP